MEPAFQRGDILFLDNTQTRVNVGDIVVFKIKGRDIPIVHRVLKVHAQPNGEMGLRSQRETTIRSTIEAFMHLDNFG